MFNHVPSMAAFGVVAFVHPASHAGRAAGHQAAAHGSVVIAKAAPTDAPAHVAARK